MSRRILSSALTITVLLGATVLGAGCATEPDPNVDYAEADVSAEAAGADAQKNPMLAELDTDGNGLIERAEFVAGAETRFADADADGNGLLVGDEIDAMMPKPPHHKMGHAKMGKGGPEGKMGKHHDKFERMDANGDGLVTRDEIDATVTDKLSRKDDNGDGVLSGDELGGKMGKWLLKADLDNDGQVTAAELAESKWTHMVDADANGDGALSHEELRAGMKEKGKGFMLAKMDTDGDGALNLDEVKVGANTFFDRMDKDQSGVIEAAEMRFKGKHGKHKHHGHE